MSALDSVKHKYSLHLFICFCFCHDRKAKIFILNGGIQSNARKKIKDFGFFRFRVYL